MSELADNPSLKEINAYKKKINWGDIPTIYHLATSAIGEIEGLLTNGFDSAFKQLLNRNNWNLAMLESNHVLSGKAPVTIKPKISLFHNVNEQHYELHCYPVVNNEPVFQAQINEPNCPFINWTPETMQILIRLNSLIPFIVYFCTLLNQPLTRIVNVDLDIILNKTKWIH